MTPKTKIQKEVARLSRRLPRITEAQKTYAYRHCFDHIGRRTAKGVITCTECGHSWQGDGVLADSLCGSACPHCGTELQILQTRKRVFRTIAYYSVITTCEQYQVIRFYYIKATHKVGQAAEYAIDEVMQRWIAPDGKVVTVARPRAMSFFYCDLWYLGGDMEVRSRNNIRAYDITPSATYPRQRIIPELRRNGFTGDYHKILPYDLFTVVLRTPQAETFLKTGQVVLLSYLANRPSWNVANYWPAIKICMRNGYLISDVSVWCDYIDLLRHFGKDTNNAKYVCPANLHAEHDRLVEKRRIQQERERLLERKRRAAEEERQYRELKSRYFGLVFTDGDLAVRVLESVQEFVEEGDAMHHCVFSNSYYSKPNSLIFSATIGGKRVETVEVALDTLKVVQSRGVRNSQTEYHNRILNLVRRNMPRIEKRMTA
ncbi:PcfJ domain-containing protein [Alistipes ihumii]|uniref:PcfJ domain-containing protein n=1 Tax=Alistipes TaxID=239759 RepID=UPI003A88FE26